MVKVEDDEITSIAAFVGMDEDEFIQQHTRLRPDRRGLSLLEKPDASCVWLEGRDCRLQAVKPRQCRAFPNEWNFPGWREKCEAVPTLRVEAEASSAAPPASAPAAAADL